jgi:flagellar motility protein MotE (MotC chaperone)
MKLKDLLGISLVSIFLFPVILIGIMLAAGVVHLEFGDGKDKDRIKTVYAGEEQARQDEAESKQLKAYKALETKEKELRDKEAEVNVEIERLENLKLETVAAKEQIAEHRRKIEELVGKSTEIQDKQIASLAEVYGGMRPEEAAPILLSLENSMVVRILKKIPETRATSKLMAALAALSVKRAAEITVLLGGKAYGAKPTASAKPAEGEPAKREPASDKTPDKTSDKTAAPKDTSGALPKAEPKTDTKKDAPGKA